MNEHHPTLVTLVLASALAAGLGACTNGSVGGITGKNSAKAGSTNAEASHSGSQNNSNSSDNSTPSDDSGSDEPIWVNGSYLTCAWQGANGVDKANVLCGLGDKNGAAVAPDPKAPVNWIVTDESGTVVPTTARSTGSTSRVEQLFTFASIDVSKRIVGWTVGKHAVTAAHEVNLGAVLPGLKDDGGLQQCFNAGTATELCLANITTATGAPVTSGSAALVQQNGANSASAISLAVSLGGNTTAGNALILCTQMDSKITGITSVTGGGVTWTQAASVTDPTGRYQLALYYGLNSSGGSSTVTVNYAGAADDALAVVTEWSGLTAAATLDGTPSSSYSVSTATVSAGNKTTTNANDFLYACAANDKFSMTSGAAGGFTALTNQSNVGYLVHAYTNVSTTGTYANSWTASGLSHSGWDAALMALKIK